MRGTHLTTRRARIDVSLDGVTVTRSESDAAARGTTRRTHVDWDDIAGVEAQTTGKGRVVIRLAVVGAPAASHHRSDPYAVRVPRKQAEAAHALVRQIDEEVAARRRWRRHEQS